MSFGSNSWTAQFYLNFFPLVFSAVNFDKSLIEFAGSVGSIVVTDSYDYSFSPHVNKLEIGLTVTAGTAVTKSNPITIPMGEWVMLTL